MEFHPKVSCTLRGHPFLKGLDPRHMDALSACSEERAFQPGEYLWRQGEVSEWLYLIDSGEVSLEISIPNEGPFPLEAAVAGEILGWPWMETSDRVRFDARAVTPVTAVALKGQAVREKCEADERLGYEILKRYSRVTSESLERMRLRLIKIGPATEQNRVL